MTYTCYMPKVFTSKTQSLGKLGEDIACRYLKSKGFVILEQNHTRKWGEIDIISKKGDKLYFVEVKSKLVTTLSSKTKEQIEGMIPEENVHPIKIERFVRTIHTYLAEKQYEGDFEAVVLAVFVDTQEKTSVVRLTQIFD
jgi:putative endonuclease